jgi:hypothetical protein
MKWVGLILVLVALASTHWSAYRLEAQAEQARLAGLVGEWFGSREVEALQQRLELWQSWRRTVRPST